MIMGIDQIRQTDLQRRQGPATRDPRVQRTKTIAEQANIHQDVQFAGSFFKKGVWANEYTGIDSTSISGKQFIKFSNDNSDPVKFSMKSDGDAGGNRPQTEPHWSWSKRVYNAEESPGHP